MSERWPIAERILDAMWAQSERFVNDDRERSGTESAKLWTMNAVSERWTNGERTKKWESITFQGLYEIWNFTFCLRSNPLPQNKSSYPHLLFSQYCIILTYRILLFVSQRPTPTDWINQHQSKANKIIILPTPLKFLRPFPQAGNNIERTSITKTSMTPNPLLIRNLDLKTG